MKISDFKDEQALDVLADILEPLGEILTDENVRAAAKEKNKLKAVKYAIKNHKKQVMYIMAVLDGKSPAEYHCNLITLPVKLLEILNDPMITEVFNSQSQETGGNASGTATVITMETVEI